MAVKFPKSERNFTKNLVKRHKLVQHLDRYLGTEVENFTFTYEPKIKDDAWHPSGHCIPSSSVLYDSVKNPVEKDWGTAMLKTFLVGHFWHQLLQKAVLDLGFAEPSAIERRGHKWWGSPVAEYDKTKLYFGDYVEQRGNPEVETWPRTKTTVIQPKPYHWATGSGDIAPCLIPNHGDYVVDFKTMSAQQYKQNGVPDWAADKYEAQINIYMDFFDLDKGLIVAICKDSPHEFKEFEYTRNQPLIDEIYAKWEFVGVALEQESAPTALENEDYDLRNLFTGPVAQ